MQVEEKLGQANRMKWLGRIIGLLVSVVVLVSMIEAAVDDYQIIGSGIFTADRIFMFVVIIAALAGCIASWWWVRLAGLTLLLASVALGVHISLYSTDNKLVVWFWWGLPYFISGVIFLLAWNIIRKVDSGEFADEPPPAIE